MRKNPRRLGDKHVQSVQQALNLLIKNMSIDDFPKTVRETAKYIKKLYPNIISFKSKFDSENTNVAKDLTLYLDDGEVKTINLFLIRKNGRIQTKNLGAKSFFSTYFLSDSMQEMFNQEFEKSYFEFLENVVYFKEKKHKRSYDKKKLRKMVSDYFPKFINEIEEYRNIFLYKLREAAFITLKEYYNDKSEGFSHAYHTLFMTEDTTIITRYGKYESSISVERFDPSSPYFTAVEIYKSGRNSVGIKYGEIALTLRFKFESSPSSSIKLAVSYDTFPSEAENESINKRTIRKMSMLIDNHQYQETRNQSNAIGKCHEAITYYYFLQYFPEISQVEPNECVDLLSKYYKIVKPEILNNVYHSTSTIVPAIREKLHEKYLDYEIESIELVPDSYIIDKLDTGDLKLVLRVNQKYQVESISLKTLARKSNKLTTKNPGIGTILGSTYFDVGDLKLSVESVKERYQREELDHRECLEILAKELGEKLKNASQNHLKRGLANLLGKAMMAITFYNENESICREHSEIESTISVFVQTPTAIQNKLTWNDNAESINLRMKFSKGQKYGWSTVKLAAEYSLIG